MLWVGADGADDRHPDPSRAGAWGRHLLAVDRARHGLQHQSGADRAACRRTSAWVCRRNLACRRNCALDDPRRACRRRRAWGARHRRRQGGRYRGVLADRRNRPSVCPSRRASDDPRRACRHRRAWDARHRRRQGGQNRDAWDGCRSRPWACRRRSAWERQRAYRRSCAWDARHHRRHGGRSPSGLAPGAPPRGGFLP
jgi:hypothetical protein